MWPLRRFPGLALTVCVCTLLLSARRASAQDTDYAARLIADRMVGTVMRTAVLPTVLHEDPRYIPSHAEGVLARAAHAAAHAAVTRSASGRSTLNVAEIGGSAIAAGLTSAYRPAADRTASAVLTRFASELAWHVASTEVKEFWPDLKRVFSKR
jgi:hypothetical protein